MGDGILYDGISPPLEASSDTVQEAREALVDEAGSVHSDVITLSIDDLLPDARGEIVLQNDAGISQVAVVATGAVVKNEVAGPHLTLDGTDVTGMMSYSFETGQTLFLPLDVNLSVLPG